MTDEQDQGGFPEDKSGGQDTYSTTGDGHPPRPGEAGAQEEGDAGQEGGGSSEGGSAGGGEDSGA